MFSDSSGMHWDSYLHYPDYFPYVNHAMMIGNDTIYACTSNGFYTTTDKGLTWEQRQIDTVFHEVWYVKKSSTDIFLAVAQNDDNFETRFFRSEDNAVSWVESDDGMEGFPNVFIEDAYGRVYMGTIGGGVFRSETGGRSWEPFNNGLSRKCIYSIYIDKDGYLYAGSVPGTYKKNKGYSELEAGVIRDQAYNPPLSSVSDEASGGRLFRIRLTPVSGSLSNKFKAAENSLDQNFPNPFNTATTITYRLQEKCQVQLSVFDVNGRLVANLVNTPKEPGPHEVVFNASALPAGVYYYQLQAGSLVQTRKMIIIK
jgi:hypothetical protein